jgi:hypothetical protein
MDSYICWLLLSINGKPDALAGRQDGVSQKAVGSQKCASGLSPKTQPLDYLLQHWFW